MKIQEIVKNNLVLKLATLTADQELVREIQSRLNALGLLQLSDVDGIFGSITKAALIRFCDLVHLNNMNTGLFGRIFFQKLMDMRGIPNSIISLSNPQNSAQNALATALKFTLKAEGGFVDHPNDLGGATNKGITQITYDNYRIDQKLPTKDVEFIENSEVQDIYFQMYWKPSQAELMVLPLAVVHFDNAVLFGVTGAILFLQEVLGIGIDGNFGAQTKKSVLSNNNKDVAIKIIDARIAYQNMRVEENPDQEVFLDGWLNRAANLRKFIKKLS